VATVETNGLVNGVGAGQSNIYFILGGHQGTKLLRGMPRVAGTFQGSYTISSCTQNGQFSDVDACINFPVGALAPYTFIFSQTADFVTGNFSLGLLNFGDFSSTIAVPGSFSFVGQASGTAPLNVVATWSLSQKVPNALGGTVNTVFSTPTLSGSATLIGTISSITRISSLDRVVRASTPRTLAEVLRAVMIPTN
jgi:hypothetical protein